MTWAARSILSRPWVAHLGSVATSQRSQPPTRTQATWLWLAGLCLALALSTVVWWPATDPTFDFWVTDDGENHLLRLFVLAHALRSGLWYPRWTPDLFLGFGYPLFNYYSPLMYYLGQVFMLLGLDTYGALQACAVGAVMVGAGGAYALGAALLGTVPRALLASAAFVLAPYPFITNLDMRGAIPEMWGAALLPWLLLAAYQTIRRDGVAPGLWLAGVLAILILMHNLSALIGMGVSLAWITYLVLLQRRWGGTRRVAIAILLALSVTAFYWLPALGERHLVQFELALEGNKQFWRWLYNPFQPVTQPFGPPPVYNQTLRGPVDLHVTYPYTLIGPVKPSSVQAALWLAGVLAIITLARRGSRYQVAIVSFFLLVAALAWWLMTTWSRPLWEAVPVLAAIQFPWRLHTPLALGVAIGGTAALPRSRRVALPLTALAVALMAWQSLAARPWPGTAQPVDRVVDGTRLRQAETDTYGSGTTGGGEFLPRSIWWAIYTPGIRRGNGIYERLYPEREWVGGLVRPFAGTVDIRSLHAGPNWLAVGVDALTPGTVALRRIAFPGWQAYLDGEPAAAYPVPYRADEQARLGFLLVDVPPGQHQVWLQFRPTPVRLIAQLITALSLAGLGGWAMVQTMRHSCPAPRRRYLHTAALASAGASGMVAGVLVAVSSLLALRAPPAQPPPESTRLVLDIIAEVQAGRARLASPSGGGLGKYLDIRRLVLFGRDRRWLYAHPPSRVTVTLDVPADAWLETGLALDPAVWAAPVGDGVRFIVEARHHTGTQVLWQRHLNPRARTEERRWNDVRVDLRPLAGETIALTLRTEPADEPSYDWAGWGAPVIVVDPSARWRDQLP